MGSFEGLGPEGSEILPVKPRGSVHLEAEVEGTYMPRYCTSLSRQRPNSTPTPPMNVTTPPHLKECSEIERYSPCLEEIVVEGVKVYVECY